MHGRSFYAVVATLLSIVILSCGAESPKDDPALARVGSHVIRQSEVDRRLELLSPMSRMEYQEEEGQRTLLGKMVEEEVYFQAAKAAGFERDPDVLEEVEKVRRQSMLRNFYMKEIREKARPTPEEIDTYYRDNIEDFRTQPRVRVRHILLKDAAEAERVRDAAEMGRDFDRLAENHSIDDKTKDSGGLIPGYLSPGHQVPLLGKVDELVEAAVALQEEGEISPVVETPLGYHVLRAEELHPGGLIPLEDVRSQIENREIDRRAQEVFQLTLVELKEKFRVEIFGEDLEPPTVSELFDRAQQARTPGERVKQYEKILQLYPDDDRAYEAQFMIGFTYSEELKNYDRARAAFEAVVNGYPESDLHDSAKWMLENLGQEDLPLDEIQLPEGVSRSSRGQ